jgi:type IV pilus assembly protein PilW
MDNMKISYYKGFSLIEILISIAISSIIIIVIYQLFDNQQRVYLTQDHVVKMQQNLRAGLYLMTKELRTAGFDPLDTGRFGFVSDFDPPNDIFAQDIDYAVDDNIIAFTIDDNEDGIIQANDNEQIAYRLNTSNNTLERYSATRKQWEPMAVNVDALNFVYLDRNGNIATNPANIHAIEITILVKTKEKDFHYTNTQTYQNKRGKNICPTCTNDHYRRRLLTTTVRVRNL